MAWAPPSDVVLGVGKPSKPSQIRAIRDLFSALAGRVSGAPWLNGAGRYEEIKGFGPIMGGPPGLPGERSRVGTWTVPDDVYRVEMTIVGGGGAGGTGDANSGGGFGKEGGGGGGAGGMLRLVFDVTPGEVHSITLGAGGNADLISPYVDTSLDNFAIGDGARTTFGVYAVGGGRRGTGIGGGTGDGGSWIDSIHQVITIPGADGGPSSQPLFGGALVILSGSGGGAFYGGGAPGRFDVGVGHSAGVLGGQGLEGVPGAGGGGGHPAFGSANSVNGGRGADGAAFLRY